MHDGEVQNDHRRFRELAAMAHGRGISDGERAELNNHLRSCEPCRTVFSEYAFLGSEGMAFLAAEGGHVWEAEAWDSQASEDELFQRIRASESANPNLSASIGSYFQARFEHAGFPCNFGGSWLPAAAAVCLLIAVGAGAYHLGNRHAIAMSTSTSTSMAVSMSMPMPKPASEASSATRTSSPAMPLTSEEEATDVLLTQQSSRISHLQKQIATDERELAGLRSALHNAEVNSSALSKANSENEAQLLQVSGERDKLAIQVRDAERAYQALQLEFTSLRAEHDRIVLRTASLESRIDELSTSTSDQDRRLKDSEQYLASDRDIRELMGARKLYIADVFDVDSGSRTRKPFGRVFYTQNKSLIFYAFDLDRQPGVRNASAFQVWGKKDGDLSAKSRPMNLGILYMDSETNRRWVLRWDDPKQLAEIDAVFVTVEPSGGSQKPTGKPFLYALLRKEANHP